MGDGVHEARMQLCSPHQARLLVAPAARVPPRIRAASFAYRCRTSNSVNGQLGTDLHTNHAAVAQQSTRVVTRDKVWRAEEWATGMMRGRR